MATAKKRGARGSYAKRSRAEDPRTRFVEALRKLVFAILGSQRIAERERYRREWLPLADKHNALVDELDAQRAAHGNAKIRYLNGERTPEARARLRREFDLEAEIRELRDQMNRLTRSIGDLAFARETYATAMERVAIEQGMTTISWGKTFRPLDIESGRVMASRLRAEMMGQYLERAEQLRTAISLAENGELFPTTSIPISELLPDWRRELSVADERICALTSRPGRPRTRPQA